MVSPFVHDRERRRGVEVLVERCREPFPGALGSGSMRAPEDVSQAIRSRRRLLHHLVVEVDRLAPGSRTDGTRAALPDPRRRARSATSRRCRATWTSSPASSSSMPLCIQILANAWPRLRDCASSFSWCGKRRSFPPPWISNSEPRNFSAMAEHSMCQPGPPGPQGDSQAASSCGFWDFQSAKSR